MQVVAVEQVLVVIIMDQLLLVLVEQAEEEMAWGLVKVHRLELLISEAEAVALEIVLLLALVDQEL